MPKSLFSVRTVRVGAVACLEMEEDAEGALELIAGAEISRAGW
jgi:hypothetical protein